MVNFAHKVLIPDRPGYFIARPHLTRQLETIVDQRLITLTGPAGYGKTALLINFAHATRLPICWYALDSFDQDPWVFLEYLAAAVEQRFPEATKQTRALIAGCAGVSFAAVATALAREIYTLGQRCAIVLDDWHLVDHVKEIRDLVGQLVQQCPNTHLILSSRTSPTLPNLMLLAARRQMSSLDDQHLRFSPQEVLALLEADAGGAPSPERAAALAEQMHGWVAGILLQAAAQACAGGPAEGPVERQTYRFLVEQVFEQQPCDLQRFLLETALLEELSAQHCDGVLQCADSRRQLDLLLRRHLFVAEIRPGVLRYHRMFREFLIEHYRMVDPEGYKRVGLQIADAYAVQGEHLLAFDRYISVGRPDAARRMIAASGEQLYQMGRLGTLESWFALLPPEQTDPALLCLRARVALDRGCYQEAQTLVDTAELCAQEGDRSPVLLLQSQLARAQGRYEQAIRLAGSVLERAPDPAQQAMAMRAIGICYDQIGQHEGAIAQFKAALAIERQRGDLYAIARLHHNLGICYKTIGRFQLAEEYYSHAESYWSTLGNTGWRALTLNSKGVVQHLAGQYQAAHATLTAALQLAREAGIPHFQTFVLASLGDLFADLQRWEQARGFYQSARKLGGTAKAMSDIDLAELQLLVRQRQYSQALAMLRDMPAVTARSYPHKLQLQQSLIAHGLGDSARALELVRQAIGALEQGPPMDLARAHLIHAIILSDAQPAQVPAVLAALERADAIVAQLGHDAFLLLEAMHVPAFMRRASAYGWPRANDWLQRHHAIQLDAEALACNDQRAVLTVRALGVEELLLNQQPVAISWQKAREILYYLLHQPGGVTIEALREAIWPELDDERRRERLRSAIYQLRLALPRELIELHGRQVYRLNLDAVRLDYDVERFLQILASSADETEALFEALDLYRGSFLASVESQWCLALRTSLEQRYLASLHRAALAYEERRSYADALLLFAQILAIDPFDELAYAGLMRCHIAQGNRAAAIYQYQTLRRLLDEELGLVPAPTSEVERLYQQMLAEG